MKANKLEGLKSKYIISTNLDDGIEKAQQNALAFLSADFLGTRFNLFDKLKASKEKKDRDNAKLLATVTYVS